MAGIFALAQDREHGPLHAATIDFTAKPAPVRTMTADTQVMFVDARTLLVSGRRNTYGRGESFWFSAPGVSDEDAADRPLSLAALTMHVVRFVTSMFQSRPKLTHLFIAPETHTESPRLRRWQWNREEIRADDADDTGPFSRELRAPYSRTEETTGFIPVHHESNLHSETMQAVLGMTLMRAGADLDALLRDRVVSPVLMSLLFQSVLDTLEGILPANCTVVFMGPIYDFGHLCTVADKLAVIQGNVIEGTGGRRPKPRIVNTIFMAGGDVSAKLRIFLDNLSPAPRGAGGLATGPVEVVSDDDAVAWTALLALASGHTKHNIVLWHSDTCILDTKRAIMVAIPDFMTELGYRKKTEVSFFAALVLLYFDSPYHRGPMGSAQTPEEFVTVASAMHEGANGTDIPITFDTDDKIVIDEPALAALWDMMSLEIAGGKDKTLQQRWADFTSLPRLSAPHPLHTLLQDGGGSAATSILQQNIATPQQMAALDAVVLARVRGVRMVESNLPGLRIPTDGGGHDGICFLRVDAGTAKVTVRSVRDDDAINLEGNPSALSAATVSAAGQEATWAEHSRPQAVANIASGVPFPGDGTPFGRALAAQTGARLLAHLHIAADDVANAPSSAETRKVDFEATLQKRAWTRKKVEGSVVLDLIAPLQQSGLLLFVNNTTGDGGTEPITGDGVVDAPLLLLLGKSDPAWRDSLHEARQRAQIEVDDTDDGAPTRVTFRPTESILLRMLIARLISASGRQPAGNQQLVEAPTPFFATRTVEAQPLFIPVTRVTEIDVGVDETVSSRRLGELYMPFNYSAHVDAWAPGDAVACPVVSFEPASVSSGLQVQQAAVDWGAVGCAYIAALHERVTTHARVPVREVCTAARPQRVPDTLMNIAEGLATANVDAIPMATRMRIVSYSADVVEHAIPLLRHGVSEQAWQRSIAPAVAVFRGVAEASFDALCRWKASQDVYMQVASYPFERPVGGGGGAFGRPWPTYAEWVAAHYALPRVFRVASPAASATLCPESVRPAHFRDYSSSWAMAALRLAGVDVETKDATSGDMQAAVAANGKLVERIATVAPNVRNMFVRLSRSGDHQGVIVADMLFVDWPVHVALHYAYWSATEIAMRLPGDALVPVSQMTGTVVYLSGTVPVVFRWRRAAI